MIRALALASLLSACSYDATIGFRTTASDIDAALPMVDAAAFPDLPANLAFDFGNAGGPLLYDGAGYVYVVQYQISGAADSLVRVDMATMNRVYVTGPAIAMVQDATNVYALTRGTSAGLSDLVAFSKSPTYPPASGPIDAADPVFNVTTLQHDIPDAAALAVDGTNLYLVQSGGSDGKLLRMDKTGANATTLLVDAGLSAVAVDDNFAYVVEHAPSGRLLAVPKSGGSTLVLGSSLVEPLAIDLAGGYVYITEQGDASTGGAIGRVAAPAAGATSASPFSRIVTDAHTPVDLTHDETYLYWTADRDGLMRAPLDGGTPDLRMGTARAGNTAIALQADHVLFVSPSDYDRPEIHAVNR